MSTFYKLIQRIKSLDKNLRFDEIRKVLEAYGYSMNGPSGGSSHKTFRKPGKNPVTIPQHEPIRKIYVILVKEAVENEVEKMNKNLEYYLNLPYRLEIIPDIEEGGFGARYPDLPGCITCSDTMEGIIENAEDAKRAWLKAALEEGIPITEPAPNDDLSQYSGQFKLRMPRSLHKSLSLQAKEEGISMNQYCIYLLAMNSAINNMVQNQRTAMAT